MLVRTDKKPLGRKKPKSRTTKSDALSKIAIKTPLGLTKRVDVVKAVAQGEIPSPLKCTVTVDSISEEHTENLSEHLYRVSKNEGQIENGYKTLKFIVFDHK